LDVEENVDGKREGHTTAASMLIKIIDEQGSK
jgi:hypothetical protein